MINCWGFCPLLLSLAFFVFFGFEFTFFSPFAFCFLLWRFLDQNHCRASSLWWWRLSFSLTLLLWQRLLQANWPELSSFLLSFPHFPPSSFFPLPPSCSFSHFLSLTSTCHGRQELSRLFVSVHTLHGMSTSGDSPISSWPQSIFLHLPFKPLTTSKQNTSNSFALLPPSSSVPLHPPCVWG